MASSFDLEVGCKATLVSDTGGVTFFFSTAFSVERFHSHAQCVIESVAPPTGTIMNLKVSLLSAWSAAVDDVIIGTGKVRPFGPPRFCRAAAHIFAAARAVASETARQRVRPSFDFVGVPSRAIKA